MKPILVKVHFDEDVGIRLMGTEHVILKSIVTKEDWDIYETLLQEQECEQA